MSAATLTALTMATEAERATFVLARLTALAARQAAATSPRERMVLTIAAFSLFLECLGLGLEAEARAILYPVGIVRWSAA